MGRSDAIAGVVLKTTSPKHLPAYIGRTATNLPPSIFTSVQSVARPRGQFSGHAGGKILALNRRAKQQRSPDRCSLIILATTCGVRFGHVGFQSRVVADKNFIHTEFAQFGGQTFYT
ncbi:MAG: hypothetical protein MZV70_38710 [Desulfobacterales bacterium]|nr:hypothetical protein [Desulfobacterales bacterium]